MSNVTTTKKLTRCNYGACLQVVHTKPTKRNL